jgi:hypothetical protein
VPCNPSTWEVEVGGLQVQSQPGLRSEFKACLSYGVRFCLLKI